VNYGKLKRIKETLTAYDNRGSIPGRGWEFFLATASRPALWPNQHPTQRKSGVLFSETKRPGREDDYSPPSSAEVQSAWSYTSTPPVHLHGVAFNQARDTRS
jgi:hypothetical protein